MYSELYLYDWFVFGATFEFYIIYRQSLRGIILAHVTLSTRNLSTFPKSPRWQIAQEQQFSHDRWNDYTSWWEGEKTKLGSWFNQ